MHERWGEAPHAFVVLKEGARADERELREFTRENTPCGGAGGYTAKPLGKR